MAFVDYEKAFDSIQHKAIFKALKQHGVEDNYINILKETYDGGTAQVRTDTVSRKICIMKGVRQGDTLSPVMFTAALEEIFRRIEYETGININGDCLNNLRFADDIILFTESEEQLGRLLNDLNKEGKKDGLKMNKRKTKIMCNEVARRTRRNGISIDGEQLEEVEEYKYLGRLLTPGNEMAREIDGRRKAGWKRFVQYSSFLKDKKIPMCMKKKIISQIRPSLEYCSHVWGGAPKSTLCLLDKVQSKAIRLINNPNLTKSLQPLSHRRLVGDLSIFYRYFNGHCSQEIRDIIPVPLRRVRTTRSSTHSHPFQVSLPNPRTLSHKSSFIPRTCNLWNVLPSSCFPESYNLPSFKSNVNKLDLISLSS